MAKFHESVPQRAGIPLGGIGTGSVELYPDGELHEWQIYNTPRWASPCWESQADDGECHAGSLAFYLRTRESGGRTLLRRLGLRADSGEFTYRMFPAVKPVESVDFDGRFPKAELVYNDRDLPCAVSSRWTAPFVPHRERDAASPAFSVIFTLVNTAEADLTLSLAAKLKTPYCNKGGEVHTLYGEKEGALLSIDPVSDGGAPDDGSIALSVSGPGSSSAVVGDYTAYLDEYVAHSRFGISQESFLFPFLKTGRLPHAVLREEPTGRAARPFVLTALPEDFFPEESTLDALGEKALDEKLDTLAGYAFAQSLLDRIREVDPGFPAGIEDKRAFLSACGRQVRDISRGKKKPFGGAALCQSVTLSPGARAEITFLFSWHFPHHIGADGRPLGHYYANLYRNAAEVNRALSSRFDEIFGEAGRFADALYDTTLPLSYPDAWSSQLSTLVKDSWWLADGRFGLWEGLGYCGFATTDITYHASFGLSALFPALQKEQMRMTAAFARSDGRIPHFFTPDLYHVDDGFHRVDLNPQFVLLTARDYLLHGDKEQLAALWPAVKAAMEATAALDANHDGLPDKDTSSNTYDAWHFSGTPSYIAFLWLSALKAAAFLAQVMEEPEAARRWLACREKGRSSVERLLFNGSYYDLWTTASPDGPSAEPEHVCPERDEKTGAFVPAPDSSSAPPATVKGEEHATASSRPGQASADLPNGPLRDQCLMTNQLDGEIFLRLIGLEGSLPDSRFEAVLGTIFLSNFQKGLGLVNASDPPGRPSTLYTHLNCQAEARWTGIEYLFAAALEAAGQRERAREVIETIEERQTRLGYFFNHWECGFRYTRPLSSWATLLAASGASFDAASELLSLTPPGTSFGKDKTENPAPPPASDIPYSGALPLSGTAPSSASSSGAPEKYPVVTATGVASAVFEPDRFTLSLRSGRISLSALRIPAPKDGRALKAESFLSGAPSCPALRCEKKGGTVTLLFSDPVILFPGDRLTVTLSG